MDKLQQHVAIMYHLRTRRTKRENEEIVMNVFLYSSTQIFLAVENFNEQYEIMIAEIFWSRWDFKMGSGR